MHWFLPIVVLLGSAVLMGAFIGVVNVVERLINRPSLAAHCKWEEE